MGQAPEVTIAASRSVAARGDLAGGRSGRPEPGGMAAFYQFTGFPNDSGSEGPDRSGLRQAASGRRCRAGNAAPKPVPKPDRDKGRAHGWHDRVSAAAARRVV